MLQQGAVLPEDRGAMHRGGFAFLRSYPPPASRSFNRTASHAAETALLTLQIRCVWLNAAGERIWSSTGGQYGGRFYNACKSYLEDLGT